MFIGGISVLNSQDTVIYPDSRICARRYLLWPSNFRIINPRNVFCGATWPLLTGMFTHWVSKKKKAPFRSKSRRCKCWLLPLNACSTQTLFPLCMFFSTTSLYYTSSMTCLSRLDARAACRRSGRMFWVGSSSRSIARRGMDACALPTCSVSAVFAADCVDSG